MISPHAMNPLRPSVPLLLALCAAAVAADPRGDSPDAPPSTPQEQLAKFHVPPGFEVQLVADETQIQKPMNLAFDAAGRLWVTGSGMYPWPARTDALGQPIAGFDEVWKGTAGSFDAAKAPVPAEQATDTVRVLSQLGPDGRARKVTIFADGLNIPIGLQPLPRKKDAKGDSAIVFSIPTIWRLTDTDGDGVADRREPLYTGFDFRDTHGMSSNYLYWVDGWIYGCHGFRNRSEVKDRAGNVTVFDSGNTYRFRPDGSKIEYYTHGQTNPFGLTVDPLGNFYSADSHSKPVYMLQRGGFYEGIGKKDDGLGLAPRITDDDHGSSAIAGIAYYAADAWPEEYRGNLFNGNPVTRRINRDRLEWHGSTPKAVRMPDFLTCDDPWFRPIQVKLGPDGALYIADFYNPIIGHYEFPLADPRRDRRHGRIWRVVWRGENARATSGAAAAPGSALVPSAGDGVPPSRTSPDVATGTDAAEVRRGETPQPARETRALPGPLPDLTTLDAAGLIAKLGDPNLTVRTLATHELVERIGAEAAPALAALLQKEDWGLGRRPGTFTPEELRELEYADLSPSPAAAQLIHAFRAAERLGLLERGAIQRGLYDDSFGLRGHILEILIERGPRDAETMRWMGSTGNTALSVRSLLRAVAQEPGARMIPFLLKFLRPSELFRTEAEDRALEYEARMALRDQLLRLSTAELAAAVTDLPTDMQEPLAEVSLAVPTSAAAEFLLAYLEHTQFAAPRAGDFLKHATLHLPEEKLPALFALVEKADAASLPQRLALADGLTKAARERKLSLPDSLEAWTQRALLQALATDDKAVLKRAIEALREAKMDAKVVLLGEIVRAEKHDNALRQAALEAAANSPASRALLVETLGNPKHLSLRKRAAELLGQNGHREEIVAALAQAPQELAITISAALAKSDPGCSALLDAIEAGKATPRTLLNKAVSGPLASRPATLRERADTLTKNLPPEDARLNQLIADRTKAHHASRADVARGAKVFEQSCAACHRFRNVGGNVGPNLDGVSARGAARLIEDILDPNRNVDPLFRQTTIETTDGETLLGANVRDEGESLRLADATGRDFTVPKAKIKTQTQSALSLMPPVFESALPPADFQDLIGYLLSAPPAAE